MTAKVSKAKGVVKNTKNYSLFKNHPKNRLIIPGHLEKLRAKIKAKNQLHLNAVIVTDYDASIDPDPENNEKTPKFYLINGNHRRTVATEEELTLYYTVDNDIDPDDIAPLNFSKTWDDADYLRYYIERPAYKLVQKFCIDYKLKLNSARCILAQRTSVDRELWNNGDFKVGDREQATIMAKCIVGLHEMLPPQMNHVPKMNRFVMSLIQATKQSNFDMDHFINQTRMNVHHVFNTPTKYFARMCIEKIYSIGSTKKFKFKEKK